MKRFLALFLSMVMLSVAFTGCGKKDELTGAGEKGGGIAFNEMGNMVDDSSDIPDWTGKKLELKMWFGQGTACVRRQKKAENDVVTPELFRLTGVKYDEVNSFDNGGESMGAKVSKILASGDWPDIVINGERSVLEKMIESDMLYDLTDLMSKYCPNIMAMAERSGKNNYITTERQDGKIYHFPVQMMSYEYVAPELTNIELSKVSPVPDPIGYVYVRDDILKKIYPNAKTQQEIEELYLSNGKFTKEEILDVPLNSKEDFFDFLYKINELGMTEGNRKVYPFYVADGLDNWSLLANLGNLYGYNLNRGADCNYFTYWDKETKRVEYIPFLREVGVHFSVNRMLAAECFKSRLEKGLTFLEFNYMLMQSYDFLKLNEEYNCVLQLGGDDQWSNIIGGIELVRRSKGKEVYGMTFTLLTTSEGKKMGKTQDGAVWLDPEKTSPYDFYQYWRNIDDADVIRCMKMLTFIPLDEITKFEKLEGSELNEAKRILAYEVTKLVHGEKAANDANAAAQAIFSKGQSSENMPSTSVEKESLKEGIGILDVMLRAGLISSKGEGRRLVQQGGLTVNNNKVDDFNLIINESYFENGEMIIKKGKKVYHKITV
jgi:tyrosyl-tRNA synthetase